MKEIDINIEGYNVNGICVGCLNYNRLMFYDDAAVKLCFKLIADIDVPDGLTIQVCWECIAAVKKVLQFRQQIIKSYEVLVEYSQKHTFLDSPEDFTKHSTTHLVCTPVDIQDTYDYKADHIDILKDEDGKIEIEIGTLKQEPSFYDEYESQDFDENTVEDIQNQKDSQTISSDEDLQLLSESQDQKDSQNLSSDEDLQLLSELKKKKEKKVKKRKGKKKVKIESKPSRKLKNLPSSIVDLYTMSEKEMWLVREQDRASDDFNRIKYKCTDCILGFNTEKLRDAHLNGKHKPKNATAQKCEVCNAYYLTSDKMSTHRALHLSAYKCTVCSHTTTLKRSMARHRCAASLPDMQHQCSNCDRVFSTKSKLSYHKSMCHQESPQCDCCGKVFANKMTLKYHLKILPQNKDEKPKEKLFIPCKGCNKIFHSKKSYRAHVVIHEGKTYPCPICGKQFQWKRNLSRHTRAHRERASGAAHHCAECDKTFSSRDCYNNHMKLSKRHAHPDTYVHECNYCGKKFPTKWCMVDHIDWDHLKRVKYQCSVCFKPFKTAKIMVAHVHNIHEGRRRELDGQHLCDICGKSYKTVKRLKGHVWAMHTQRSSAKSYKCKLCAATFTWQTSIYKHMKMMHDNKRTKPPRTAPAVKKTEQYTDIELSNRMYFNNMTHLPQTILTNTLSPL